MSRNPHEVSAGGSIIVLFVLLTAIILQAAFIADARLYWCLFITIPAIILVALFIRSKKINIK
jgi:hypothetical protein